VLEFVFQKNGHWNLIKQKNSNALFWNEFKFFKKIIECVYNWKEIKNELKSFFVEKILTGYEILNLKYYKH